MQIIVFGMHRSGTSPLARLMNMMGAYTGPEGSLIEPRGPNPKGYWERKDVQLLNDEILQSVGATWSRTLGFEPENLNPDTLTGFEHQAAQIIYNLDAHRPWVVKDPRLCLTFPVWRKLLEVPVCVHIHRNPLEVAQSLKTRGDLPVSTSIALWEKYNLAVLAYTQGLPRVSVSHRQLMEQPVTVVKTLYEELTALGVQGLRCPDEREVRAFINVGLYHERMQPQHEQEFVNAVQLKLFAALEDDSVQDWETLPALSGGALEVLARHEQDQKNAPLIPSLRADLQAKQAEVEEWRQKVAAAETAKQSEVAAVEAAKQAEVEEWRQKVAAAETAKQSEVAAAEAAKQAEVEEWRQKVAAAETAKQSEVAAVEAAKQAEVEEWRQKVAAAETAKQSEVAAVEAAKQAEVEEWRQKVAAAETAKQSEVAAVEAAKQAEVEEWRQKVASATRRAAEHEAKFAVMRAARYEERQRLDARLAQLQSQLQEAGKRIVGEEAKQTVGQTSHHEERQRSGTLLAQLQDQLKNALSTTAQKETQVAALTRQLQQRSEEVKRLIDWMEKFDTSTSALLQSNRWKIGSAVGEMLRRVQFKPRVPMAPDAFRTILEQFHTWKRDADLP